MIVFSQHGARDLPSQLGGGDLDGDTFHIIFDPRLCPLNTFPAAEYPRVKPTESDRPVTTKDMSDFFVTFMETDQTGMLSTKHLQRADQQPLGVLDPGCIKIAHMASVAVDYSKTGIPIDMSALPPYDRFRPDFMAPSPRVLMSSNGELGFEEQEGGDDDDAFEGIDEEKKPNRFYRSEKVLGHLYTGTSTRSTLLKRCSVIITPGP